MERRALLLRVAAVAYLLIVYLLLYTYYPESMRAPLGALLPALVLGGVAEALRGIRLYTLYRSVSGDASLGRALRARFIGNLFALLTPSVAGGEVARGVVLHGRLEKDAMLAVGVAALDSGLDLLGNYVLALAALVAGCAPAAPLPELLALPAFLLWMVAVYLVAVGRVEGIIARLEGLMESRAWGRPVASLLSRLRGLRVKPRVLAAAFALTIAAWMLTVASYAVFAGAICLAAGCVAEDILAGVVPAPGGIGPGEALLAGRCPGIAAWRGVYVAAMTLPGAFLLVSLRGETRGLRARQ